MKKIDYKSIAKDVINLEIKVYKIKKIIKSKF